MKIRNGFVSNSSSTSFIVSESSKLEAINFGLELIPVKYLKAYFNNIRSIGGGFLLDYVRVCDRLNELNDSDYITKPYDRDRAFEQGIDFPVFQGDL